jgi:hypothetical protein
MPEDKPKKGAADASDDGADHAAKERAARVKARLEDLKAEWRGPSAPFGSGIGIVSPTELFGPEFDRVVPIEVRAHLLNAQRELLLAARKTLDYFIERSGGSAETPEASKELEVK